LIALQLNLSFFLHKISLNTNKFKLLKIQEKFEIKLLQERSQMIVKILNPRKISVMLWRELFMVLAEEMKSGIGGE